MIFKTSSLSSGLLLDRHDLQDLILELGSQKGIDDLGFFDGEREEVDLFQGPDFPVLDETAQLGDGDPLVLLLAATSTASATAATTATSAAAAFTTSTATSVAKSTSKTSTIAGWCSV